MHEILDWANLTLIVTGIFFAGVVWNKVDNLEKTFAANTVGTDIASLKERITSLKEELERVRDRLDLLLDSDKLH